ncbi:MAG: bifunctional diaminohydroxyphosphoribosylaminopyrimidine deaminase/5-amino-6-(5-phosphoribosylamino)uracil reductase RibD [bacterium]
MNAADHIRFMDCCLQLAEKGRGRVHPNPMVGCVIVKHGRIIAEGYHRSFGGPHAEIEALRIAGNRSSGATLYVNLEPCAHYGKTPPCSQSIIEAGISQVVAACRDPNPEVAGKGFSEIRRAGIALIIGIRHKEAAELNHQFFYTMKTELPYIGIKIAQTIDGRISDSFGKSKWITSAEARKEGHRIRSEYDAILVGVGTVLKDNPQLTVRSVRGKNPIRIIIDGHLRVSDRAKVFDVRKADTILLTSSEAMNSETAKVSRLARRGVEVFGLDGGFELSTKAILKVLASLGINSILVEGGSGTISRFMEDRYVQKIHCFIAPKILGGGLPSIMISRHSKLRQASEITHMKIRSVGKDLLVEGLIHYK